MEGAWREVARLHFSGPAGGDDHLLLSELPELITYQQIITEAARALFLRDHPSRQRVAKGFGDSLQLGFATIQRGSTVIPLDVRETPVPVFAGVPVESYVDRAATVTANAYRTSSAGKVASDLPPENVLRLMETFGSTLSRDRSLEIEPTGAPGLAVRVDRHAREAIALLIAERVQDEAVVRGEVTRADVVARRFVVRTDEGGSLEAPYDTTDERRVTEALRDHDVRRVLVRGRVLRESSGRPVRFVSVSGIQFVDDVEGASPRSTWERLLLLAEHPVQGLPSDLASHLDDHLYSREHH